MILALDVGNSQIFGGVMVEAALDPKILATFRMSSKVGSSSDEYGLFLRQVLRENGLDSAKLTAIVICSVVPGLMHSLSGACQKYFKIQPLILQAGVKTGLKIKYKNPLEVGADRIANAIAASIRYPKKNLIIIDMGTATTLCAVTANRDYLGGAILAGLKISMEALESRTAKLPTVEIIAPQAPLGQSTVESIQSGLYFGHVGAMRELTSRVAKQSFGEEPYFVVGTGGFSRLFSHEKLFDVEVPHLVLLGLYDALRMNSEQGPKIQGAPHAANGPDAHDSGRN